MTHSLDKLFDTGNFFCILTAPRKQLLLFFLFFSFSPTLFFFLGDRCQCVGQVGLELDLCQPHLLSAGITRCTTLCKPNFLILKESLCFLKTRALENTYQTGMAIQTVRMSGWITCSPRDQRAQTLARQRTWKRECCWSVARLLRWLSGQGTGHRTRVPLPGSTASSRRTPSARHPHTMTHICQYYK